MNDISPSHEAALASREFHAIAGRYGARIAERSGVPYIRHVIDGLWILDKIDACLTARLAYCLHPLAQADEDLSTFDPYLASTPEVLLATIEYRNVANRYLSFHHGQPGYQPLLSPVASVNEMLVADKVQNRKEFEIYRATSHPNTERLADYFRAWLTSLGISEARYRELAGGLLYVERADNAQARARLTRTEETS